MEYKITDQCVNCLNCVAECSLHAISEQGNRCEIDRDVCISCGACTMVCPIDAIVEEG